MWISYTQPKETEDRLGNIFAHMELQHTSMLNSTVNVHSKKKIRGDSKCLVRTSDAHTHMCGNITHDDLQSPWIVHETSMLNSSPHGHKM